MSAYRNIPEELKQNGLFCVWRREKRKGNMTKVPYQRNGYGASTTERRHFCGFEEAVRLSKKYDGIGIGVFDGYSAVDIDHCVKNGKLSEMALEIINTMNSYTEYSPSGEGVRIIFKASPFDYDKEKYYINNRKIGLEVYVSGCTNKFVTLTGNVIRNVPVAERTAEIRRVLESYMLRPQRVNQQPEELCSQIGSLLSDNEVLEKAMVSKNSAKFGALWNGDFLGKSHSEADLALCSMLAFWCGGDTAQMDRLFRQSAQYRQKWERDDYREETLRKAVNGCTEFYSPTGCPGSQCGFGEIGLTKRRANAASERGSDGIAQIEQSLRELDAASRCPQTDIGAGRLFADCFKGSLRYVRERKSWFFYENGVWSEDVGSLIAMEKLKELADALMHYALTIQDERVRKEFIRFCTRWQARHNREVFLKDAQSVHPISASVFDVDPYVFNCKNGTLRLDTMTFSPHDPDDFLTKISDVTYDPEARCERFERFIGEITEDVQKARFLQKALGYGLSGDTQFECMFIMYGATTRNGKGTLCESVLKVLGKYGCTSRPETLSVKINPNSTAPSEDIARLAGIRFVNISEPGKGLVLNAAQVKTMTGNDTINARFLRENSFDYKPQFKLYVNTNYLPTVTDMTLFSGGRVMIIPFDRHFDEGEQDRTLKREFAKPENRSAILNWLIEGYCLLQKEGLEQPEAVQKATEGYRDESDKIKCFADDCLAQDDTQEVRTSSVYQRYKDWCYDSGQHCENMRNFNQALRTFAEIKRKRPKNGGAPSTFLMGYRLITDFEYEG